MKMYAFSTEEGRCIAFSYTGCAGNENHFYSEGHCMMYCGPYARRDADKGKGTAPVCDMSPYSSKSDCYNRKRLSNYW